MENPNFIFSSGSIELKQEGEDFFVEGYITTSDIDLVNDIVTKNCIMDMAEQMRERTIKLDIEHESFAGKSDLEREINKTIIPAAKIEDFLVDKKGLKVRAMLNRHVQRFNEVKNSIQDGFLDAFSIAFMPVKATLGMKEGHEVRLLDKINLLNVAFTGNPINTNASIEKVFMKSLEFLDDQEKAKPKKPKPQPDPHKEPEDEDEEDEEKGCKKPKKKDHDHISDDTIKLQEVKDMTEDTDKPEGEESTEDKPEVEAGKEVDKKDETVEDKPEDKPEEPGKEEVKSLKKKVEDLTSEIAEIKNAIKRPVTKSQISTEDKSKNFEEKSLNPLDVLQ